MVSISKQTSTLGVQRRVVRCVRLNSLLPTRTRRSPRGDFPLLRQRDTSKRTPLISCSNERFLKDSDVMDPRRRRWLSTRIEKKQWEMGDRVSHPLL